MHGNKLFTGIENVRGFFLFDVAPVYEIEYPWRMTNAALFIHIWPGKALVIGWWLRGLGEKDNLLRAIRGREHEKTVQGTVQALGRQDVCESQGSSSTDEFN